MLTAHTSAVSKEKQKKQLEDMNLTNRIISVSSIGAAAKVIIDLFKIYIPKLTYITYSM